MNEELQTVNQEHKSKIEELARANADLQNLMASTDIATVFVDRQLRLRRYTPRATELFHFVPTDAGRPLAHVKHRLAYPKLLADVERVIARLETVEREVADDAGRWFLVQLTPYHTVEDRIDGVVLALVEITRRREAEDALRRSAERAAFRAALADALRPLTDPEEVQAEAARVLGEHLGASRVHYAEFEPDGEHAVIARDYARGAPNRAGRYRVADFATLHGEARPGARSWWGTWRPTRA